MPDISTLRYLDIVKLPASRTSSQSKELPSCMMDDQAAGMSSTKRMPGQPGFQWLSDTPELNDIVNTPYEYHRSSSCLDPFTVTILVDSYPSPNPEHLHRSLADCLHNFVGASVHDSYVKLQRSWHSTRKQLQRSILLTAQALSSSSVAAWHCICRTKCVHT